MELKKLDSYKTFSGYITYPMVIFEKESGNVIEINEQATQLLGDEITQITIQPERTISGGTGFWNKLEKQESVVWHRITLITNEHSYLVGGILNRIKEEDKDIYMLMFEFRSDKNTGSVTLERMMNHAGIIALHFLKNEQNRWHIGYITQNIDMYGYDREQLYNGSITFQEIICPDDWERVYATFKQLLVSDEEGTNIEFRIITETREFIPIRINIYVRKDDSGKIVGFEVLAFNLSEESKKIIENQYLSRAIDKIQSVVLVKSFNGGKRTLKYISSNAAYLGMNVDALRKGYKLSEDYIHPDDRETVIDIMYQAIANEVMNYTQTYRMVSDDGKCIWVKNQACVARISDGEAEIEFLLTDITEQKELEQKLALAQQGFTDKLNYVMQEDISEITYDITNEEALEQMQQLVDALAKTIGVYTTIIGMDGKSITKPAGPPTNMGRFFDMFERPQYKSQYMELNRRICKERYPSVMRLQNNEPKIEMSGAPIFIGDNHVATWLICGFNEEECQKAEHALECQWVMVNNMSRFLHGQAIAETESRKSKIAELKLNEEMEEKKLFQDILFSMNIGGMKSLNEVLAKSGTLLKLENVLVFVQAYANYQSTYYRWSVATEGLDTFPREEGDPVSYEEIKEYMNEHGQIIVETGKIPECIRSMCLKYHLQALIMFPLTLEKEIIGFILFADLNKVREFSKKEISFAKNVTNVVETVLINGREIGEAKEMYKGFLDVYKHIKDAIFIKNNKNNEIIYTNKAMNKLFGEDLIGKPANNIVVNEMEKYNNIQAIRKRFISNKKEMKWKSYIKTLDQIMEIVEIRMDWLHHEDYSLVIMKKQKKE